MKKLFASLLCTAAVVSMMVMQVDAENLQNEDVMSYKISSLTGDKDPYKMGTAEDSQITYYTYGSGDIAMKGENIVYTPKADVSMYEAVFRENEWCVPVDDYSFLKIVYKTNKAYTGDTATTYWMSGNIASFTFDLKATGEWEEAIIDLNSVGINWDSYCDDGKWDQSACLNEPKIRSFRFDFPNVEGLEVEIDYVAYLSSEEAAERFDGTLESLTAEPETVAEAVDAPAAPATFDAVTAICAAGIASLVGYAVSRKKMH